MKNVSNCFIATFYSDLRTPESGGPAWLKQRAGTDAGSRFNVYRNNHVVGLVDALADTFDVTRQLVGEEFFRAMAAEFVRMAPPRSPMLFEYGEAFADFIAGFAPAQSLPYLPEVARLEFARTQSWHAADAPVVRAEDFALALADPARLEHTRAVFAPATRLLSGAHAAVSLWSAHQSEAGLARLGEIDPDTPEDALVTRPAEEVEVRLLAPGGHAFFTALSNGLTLGEAAQAGARAASQFDLTRQFAVLIDAGAACALVSPENLT